MIVVSVTATAPVIIIIRMILIIIIMIIIIVIIVLIMKIIIIIIIIIVEMISSSSCYSYHSLLFFLFTFGAKVLQGNLLTLIKNSARKCVTESKKPIYGIYFEGLCVKVKFSACVGE